MQTTSFSRGLISFFTIFLIVFSIYMLSFTWFVHGHETKLEAKAKTNPDLLIQFDKFILHFYKHHRLADDAAQVELFELVPEYALKMLGTKTLEDEKKFFKTLAMIVHPDKNVGADKATLAFYTLLSKYHTHYHQQASGGDKPSTP